MDNVLKSKLIELKENFNIDIKNINFYKKIKNVFNKTVFLSASSIVSFLLSVFILNGIQVFAAHFFISLIFLPFFMLFFKKLNLKHPAKFTLLSSKLPAFLSAIPFIKSAENSFFFTKDKIAKLLVDENFQLVFYDFFNMAKHNIFRFDEQRRFTQNIVFFKSFLEAGNFIKAADYFMELYSVAQQFEYLVYDDYQSPHDLKLLKARKNIIDEFLKETDIGQYVNETFKAKSLTLNKDYSNSSRPKVNWKKLMDE